MFNTLVQIIGNSRDLVSLHPRVVKVDSNVHALRHLMNLSKVSSLIIRAARQPDQNNNQSIDVQSNIPAKENLIWCILCNIY